MSLSDILLTGLPFFLGNGNLAKIENIFGTLGKKEIEMEILSAQKQQMKKNTCTCQSVRIAKVKKKSGVHVSIHILKTERDMNLKF